MSLRRSPAWAAALVLALSPISVEAQTVRRFDMGPSSGPVTAGFSQVTTGSLYTASLGYGWTVPPSGAYLSPSVPLEVQTTLPASLLRDGVESASNMTFRVDVPPGTYEVVVYLGNLGTPAVPTPRDGLDIKIGTTEYVSDAFARTMTFKAQLIQLLGGYKRVRFLATTSAGRLSLNFHCNGSGSSINSVMGVEVYPTVAAPIRFDHATRQLVADPAFASVLAPALAVFNSDDYATAKTLFGQVADARLKAWGFAWCIGWMTGEEADADLSLLSQAKALLLGLNSPNDPTVALLLKDLEEFELGELFNRTRGYSSNAVPTSLNSILKNLNAACQLLEQFRDDTLLPAASASMPESPLFPRTQFLLGRNMWGRNTGINDPLQPFTAYWLSLLAAFQPNFDLFPKAADAKVMAFVATNYAVAGGITKNWTGPGSVPSFDPATTWWAPLAITPNHPAAPIWANQQRRYHRAFRNAGTWWMTNRLIAGEIGGGDGDDVEGVGLLGLPTVVRNEPNAILEEGVTQGMDLVLSGSSVDQLEAYFANCGDVEHAAEFTTNPLYILLFSNYGEPKYLNFAMRTIRNMDETADAHPWTLSGGSGLRQFLGFNFGANSVCGAPRDIPLNMRAGVPGFFLEAYNAQPRTVQMFDELARAWAAHAMSTAQGKPRGAFPGSVASTGTPVFGTNGNWWQNDGYYDLTLGTNGGTSSSASSHAYLYELLLSAYARSSAPDRHVFLEPIYRAGLLVHQDLLGQLSGNNPGEPAWTASALRKPIADAVAAARPLLAADTVLALPPAELAKMDFVVQSAPTLPYLKYLNQPGTTTKSKLGLEKSFGDAAVWMESFWPLGTTTVSYSDRIFVFFASAHHDLHATMTGSATWGTAPASVISWTNTTTAQGPLDIAALVHDIQDTGLDLLVMNFGAQPRDLGVRFWQRMPPGIYEIKIGNDANHNDFMDGAPHTTLVVSLNAPGQTVVLPMVPSGVLQKIEVRQTSAGAAPSLLPDPAIGPDDVLASTGSVTVSIHNLGSADVIGCTLEVLDNGTLLNSASLPPIAAPLALTPQTFVRRLSFPLVAPGTPLTIRVVPAVGTSQITTANDSVTVIPAP